MYLKNGQKHMIDFLFPLALLLLFAASAAAVLVFAARVYSDTVDNSAAAENSRTAAAYITEKLHRADVSGSVSIGELDGCTALVLEQSMGNDSYHTYIYVFNGKLCEAFVKQGVELPASAGTPILELEELELSQPAPGLLRFTGITADGQRSTALVALRSEGAAA